MARLRASWRTSLPVVQQPRNPQSESIARCPYDTHRELAARLRQGQVYAADRTFAPAVQREIFDALCELAGPGAAPAPIEITASKDEAAPRPASWDDIRVGSFVIAQESPQDGW